MLSAFASAILSSSICATSVAFWSFVASLVLVVVNARISKSGTPQGASGDLEAVAVPLTQNGKLQQVELIINQIKP